MISTHLPAKYVAIDTETTGLNPWRGDRMFSVAAAFPTGRILYWRGEFGGLRELLEDEAVDKVFHNAKFDLRMLEFSGYKVRGRVWDTMIFGHLLDGDQSLKLENMAKRYLPRARWKVVDELNTWFDDNGIPKAKRGRHFADLPPGILEKRNTGDAVSTMLLFQKFYHTVAVTFPLLLEQEHNLIPVVKKMENRGIVVDYDEVHRQMDEYAAMVDDVVLFCEGVVGWEGFNLNSKAHQEELLDKAGLLDQIQERTKTGHKRLNDWNLRLLRHPVAHMLMMGKAAAKMRDTFLDQAERLSVPTKIDGLAGNYGVLHTTYNQTGTVTGRFSSSGPNLQNIPIEGSQGGRTSYTNEEAADSFESTGIEFSPHIKNIFVVRPGFAHVHSDKSRAEMMMLAHYTKDPVLIEMVQKSDPHTEICMRLFGSVTKGLRTRAKIVVFGFMYGAGDKTLALKIGDTIEVARDTRRRLEKQIPSLNGWRNEMRDRLKDCGYVVSSYGRRYYLKVSENIEFDESYMSVNRMCQGTVGDEIKSRMIALDNMYRSECPDCCMILNIHDDLGTEVPLDEVHRMAPRIYNVMCQTGIKFNVPMPSSCDITFDRWANLKEIKWSDNGEYESPDVPSVHRPEHKKSGRSSAPGRPARKRVASKTTSNR